MQQDVRLATTMRDQYGLINRRQARAAGMTDNQIKHRLKAGLWHRVDRAVFQHASATICWRSELVRVHLATGAIASHRSAGELWGLVEDCGGLLELTSRSHHHMVRPGVVLHESTQVDLFGVTRIDDVPCTGLLRTVLDLAAVVPRYELDHVVDAALRRSELDWPDLYRVLMRHSVQGRDGCGRLRALLDQRYGETAIPDSKWNRWVAELLEAQGLPFPEFEYTVTDLSGFIARVDLAYPALRVAIELDSIRWHLNSEAFVGDRRKRNRLLAAGWQVLAFTWDDYRNRPNDLCRQVQTAIARAA